jgi:hypothetical protein
MRLDVNENSSVSEVKIALSKLSISEAVQQTFEGNNYLLFVWFSNLILCCNVYDANGLMQCIN